MTPTLTDAGLDTAYTHLCNTLSAVGEADATLLLARFAMLAIVRIGDVDAITAMIDDAAEGLPEIRP